MAGIEQLDPYTRRLLAESPDPEGEAEAVDILVTEGCYGIDLDEVHREVLAARIRRKIEQISKAEQVDKEGTA